MQKDKKLMYAVYASFFISSISVLLTPFGDYDGSVANIIAAYAVGVLFWLFLVIGYILLGRINAHRLKQGEIKVSGAPGIFRFFSNKTAIIYDVLFLVSVAAVILLELVIKKFDIAVLFFIAAALFSFHMHGITNGVNYKYVNFEKESGEHEN